MSMIRLFCRECGYDGNPNDSPEGFIFKSANVLTLFKMSPTQEDMVTVISAELTGNPIEAIIEASKKNQIICSKCGSSNVELVCEADVNLQRKQQEVIDAIDIEESRKDITISTGGQRDIHKIVIPQKKISVPISSAQTNLSLKIPKMEKDLELKINLDKE